LMFRNREEDCHCGGGSGAPVASSLFASSMMKLRGFFIFHNCVLEQF